LRFRHPPLRVKQLLYGVAKQRTQPEVSCVLPESHLPPALSVSRVL